MTAKLRLALIAHDRRKDEMVDRVGTHIDRLAGVALCATGTTGGRILERHPALDLTRLRSGPLGGDQQIGAMIASTPSSSSSTRWRPCRMTWTSRR